MEISRDRITELALLASHTNFFVYAEVALMSHRLEQVLRTTFGDDFVLRHCGRVDVDSLDSMDRVVSALNMRWSRTLSGKFSVMRENYRVHDKVLFTAMLKCLMGTKE